MSETYKDLSGNSNFSSDGLNYTTGNFSNTNLGESSLPNTMYSPNQEIGNHDPIAEQILMAQIKLDQLNEKKKGLEVENENLNYKINDLRLIIERISNENE